MNSVKGIFLIVGSLFLMTAIGFTGFRLYRFCIAEKMIHSKYVINSIIQTGPEKEALPSIYLEELLGLSYDAPQNYYTFDEVEAGLKLLKSPVIKNAKVKKVKPDTIYIDYEVYKPIALVGDVFNLGIDEEGNLFPIEPFFSQKRLPECYFGSKEIEKEKLDIALAILSFLDKRRAFSECLLKSIDVSHAVHESFGKREVVLIVEEKGQTWYLRLTPHRFPEELNNFITLKETALSPSKNKKIVDLRLSKAAYIEEVVE